MIYILYTIYIYTHTHTCPYHTNANTTHIQAVKISPDEKSIVTVGTTGEIIFWEMPNLNKLSNAYAD